MNYFNRNKWWMLAIVLLIIINTATLVAFWVTRKTEFKAFSRQNMKGEAKAYLIKELGFDSLQQLQYNQLIQEHQKSVREIKKQVQDAKDTFFTLLNDSTVNDATIANASKQTVELESKIDILTFNHFKQVRALCTADQKKKFDVVIKNAVRMMGPQQPPRPHGPPPNGEQGLRPDGPPPQDGREGEMPPPPDRENRP